MKIELAKNENIHFVGIGGIGMSGLALIMQGMGFKIQGSDILINKNIERLKKNKIKIFIGHNKKNIDKATILVISSAIKKNNPELKILDAQIKANKLNLRSSIGSTLPSVNLSVGMNASSPEEMTSEFFEDNYIKSANLTISIPIFSGLKNRNNVQISKIRLGQSERTYKSSNIDSRVALSSLINTLNNYEEIIPIYEEVLISAEEDLRLAQNKYELGSATILELLDAQLAVLQASSTLVTTKSVSYTHLTLPTTPYV